ncbi:MAG TPA: hypothetical protein PLN21_01795 [Gemmatales bacterium]|nr:hypothetical protein [Gemmatales bacterium]
MNQLEPLPAIWDKLLDSATLDQYFKDLATYAEIISVHEKQSPSDHVGENPIDLPLAREKMMTGEVRAVQIRYRFEDQEWCDTLLHQALGVKLVRMMQRSLDRACLI